jgi:dimethylamine/trimethylamine dehydrogenase
LVSAWTTFPLEQEKIQKRLIELEVEIFANRNLQRIGQQEIELVCVFTERRTSVAARSVVMITPRLPCDSLFYELTAKPRLLARTGIATVTRIGDCLAPGMIAHAVFSGHRFAQEFQEPVSNMVSFTQEPIALDRR